MKVQSKACMRDDAHYNLVRWKIGRGPTRDKAYNFSGGRADPCQRCPRFPSFARRCGAVADCLIAMMMTGPLLNGGTWHVAGGN